MADALRVHFGVGPFDPAKIGGRVEVPPFAEVVGVRFTNVRVEYHHTARFVKCGFDNCEMLELRDLPAPSPHDTR